MFRLRAWPARLAMASVAIFTLAAATDSDFNTAGYRIAHYRSPIPNAPEGAPQITLADAHAAWRRHRAIFIDVLPAEGAVPDPQTGIWRLSEPHESIAGANWFPGAGKGDLDDATARWFDLGISRLTHGRKNRMLVLFCKADCWISWNAARYLAARGYTNVRWLAEGVDGWREEKLPLAPLQPEPRITSATSDNR